MSQMPARGKCRQGQHGNIARWRHEYHQHHAAMGGNRRGQPRVGQRVVALRLREDDVQQDRASTGHGEAFQRVGQHLARPRPAAQPRHAFFVDGQNQNLGIRRAARQRDTGIKQPEVGALQPVPLHCGHQQGTQQQRQERPFAQLDSGTAAHQRPHSRGNNSSKNSSGVQGCVMGTSFLGTSNGCGEDHAPTRPPGSTTWVRT